MPPVVLTDVLGLFLFVGGLTFEVAADRQKSQWMREKREKKHSEEFLNRGLWSRSWHPNYFGECTLWTGIAITAAGVLMNCTGQARMGLTGKLGALMMAGVTPAFVTLLLLKVSLRFF
jgi:steroid 5-alpha reductase family enzyme